MATPMNVFERVIHLSDNGDENTGKFDIQDNREYKFRLLAIINIILNELYPYSDTCITTPGKRSVLEPIEDLDEDIDLDNYCIEVMVYGVAARMFVNEDSTLASFCQQEYERRLNMLQSGAGMAASDDSIVDVYSGGYYDENGNYQYATGFYPHNDFGHW